MANHISQISDIVDKMYVDNINNISDLYLSSHFIQIQTDGENITFGIYSEKERKNVDVLKISLQEMPPEVQALFAKCELLKE